MRLLGAAVIILALATGADAGNLHSKAGATATVSSRYASRFQAVINDLEAHGARIRFMGGIRRGYCGQASKHPCGLALDICQLGRGVVDRRCNLPGRVALSAIARKHGLFSGGDWCSSDYGHVEAGGSVACGQSWAKLGGNHEGRHHRHIASSRHDNAGSRIEAASSR